MQTKLVPIGNSKGVRLPKSLLTKYHLSDQIELLEREDGILLCKKPDGKLSFAEAYQQQAASGEDWSDWTEIDLDIEE